VRVHTGDDAWETLRLTAIPDFETARIHRLFPREGAAVPGNHQVVLEHKTLSALETAVGADLLVELEDGTRRSLPVVGAVLDQTRLEQLILGEYRGFITYDTLTWLHAPESLDQLYVVVADEPNNAERILSVTAAVTRRLERSTDVTGAPRTALHTRMAPQDRHPLKGILDALLLVMIIIGGLVLFLSGSLIFNTMSALLSQHLRQIGVMKLVGARRRQVIGMYLLLITTFGMAALVVSVPSGAVAAYQLTRFVAFMVNFEMSPFRLIPEVLAFQVAVGMLVPPAAGLLPVLRGSRIRVREALSSSGLTDGETAPAEGRTPARSRRRMGTRVVLALRNTFRRKGRLALTLLTLTLGGAVFIAVFNTQASLNETTAQTARYFGADVNVDFARPYRINVATREMLRVEGVTGVEAWTAASGALVREDGAPGESVSIIAPPVESALVEPRMLAGRWLLPGDETAIAVNEAFWRLNPELAPGDTLRMEVAGRTDDWTVVGVFRYTGVDTLIGYAPYATIARLRGGVQRATMFRLTTEEQTLEGQIAVVRGLEARFRELGYTVAELDAGKNLISSLGDLMGILTTVLLAMALMTALVGGIGLAGTMSMNVMERTREIGVLRAIGGHNRIIARLVIVEGLTIGLLSYGLGVILSFPISIVLSSVISRTIFDAPAEIAFTARGFLIWLGGVVLLSVVASLLPARNASRLTIREVLAYE
jgi:putative ABC transport system permease protein